MTRGLNKILTNEVTGFLSPSKLTVSFASFNLFKDFVFVFRDVHNKPMVQRSAIWIIHKSQEGAFASIPAQGNDVPSGADGIATPAAYPSSLSTRRLCVWRAALSRLLLSPARGQCGYPDFALAH